MTEEKAKSLIWRKVRGFKGAGFTKGMNQIIGQIGIITEINVFSQDCLIDFGNTNYYFSLDEIEAHLVEEEPTSEYHLVQIEGEDFSYKTVNITASELINQNEQLKAENAEFLELLKMHVENRKGAYKFMNNIEKELHEKTKQTLEKHGK